MNALLLDLDDTLLDYQGGVEDCWASACRTCCTAAVDPDQLLPRLVDSRRAFWTDDEKNRRERVNMLGAWQKIVAEALGRLGVTDGALAAAIAREFWARRRETMRLFPEALECLATLRDRGVPLGLVTNGDASQQRFKIERHALAPYFGAIVIEGEFGVGKPDSAVYRHVLATLGASPERTWMVGDNLEADVEGAQRLGIRGVWVDRAGAGLPSGSTVRPDHVIRSLHEICELVR